MEAALAPWFHRYDTMMDPLLFFRFSIDSAKSTLAAGDHFCRQGTGLSNYLKLYAINSGLSRLGMGSS
jgi:hypothetical protein